MSEPRVLVLRAPGTNCDAETAFAFETAGGRSTILHINRVLEAPALLAEYQILCIPGGFSYGDDIAAGRILANQIDHHLLDALGEFRDSQKLVLGICNGFQMLLKSGLLLQESDAGQVPSERTVPPLATLTWNDSGKFEDRWVKLQVCGSKSVFLEEIDEMYLPVAHAEGKFAARDEAALDSLDAASQLVLRYAAGNGNAAEVAYPENPNGAQRDVAGVCDATGRVLGLMPHPERYIDRTQHPRWTRGEGRHPGDGLQLFQNAISFFR